MSRQTGLCLPEILVAVVVLTLAAAAAVPALDGVRRRGRLAAAARGLAMTYQALRWRSVAESRAHAVAFETGGAAPVWRIVRDGDGDGVRRADIRDGIDTVLSGPHRPLDHDGSIRVGVAGPGPWPGVPPSGAPPDPDDPVRFGVADLASFSPAGSATSGTVFLTDGRETMAVVLYGPTARVRVWRLRDGAWTR